MPVPHGPSDLLRERAGVILAAEQENPLMLLAGTVSEDQVNEYCFPIYELKVPRGTTTQLRFQVHDLDRLPEGDDAPDIGGEPQTKYVTEDVTCEYFRFRAKCPNLVWHQQAVSFDLKEGELTRLGQNAGSFVQRSMLNQLSGNVATAVANQASHKPLSLGNAVTAVDASHTFRAPKGDGTANATDVAVGADDTSLLTSEVLSEVLMRATSRRYVTNPMAKPKTPWGYKFPVLVSTDGLHQLHSNDPRNSFESLQKSLLAGGEDYLQSAIANFTGFVFEDMVVLECPALNDPAYPVRGLNGADLVSNTSVALFLGVGAGMFLFGDGFGDGDHWGYAEMPVLRHLSMLTDTVQGFKRVHPPVTEGSSTRESWGVFKIVHYSKG